MASLTWMIRRRAAGASVTMKRSRRWQPVGTTRTRAQTPRGMSSRRSRGRSPVGVLLVCALSARRTAPRCDSGGGHILVIAFGPQALGAIFSQCHVDLVGAPTAVRASIDSCRDCMCVPKVRWFTLASVMGAAGVVEEQAMGDFCWVCGTAAEVWPLKSKQEVVEQMESDINFKREFLTVAAGVEKAEHSLLRQQDVLGLKASGVRVLYTLAVVPEEVFAIHFSCALGTPGLTAKRVTIRGPEGQPMTGTFMQLWELPPNLPHYRVEYYGSQERQLCDVLLGRAELLGKGQAADRFSLSIKNMVFGRDTSVQGKHISRVPKYATLKSEAEAVQKKREEEAQAAAMEMDASVSQPAATVVVTGSRLDDDEDGVGQRDTAGKGGNLRQWRKGGRRLVRQEPFPAVASLVVPSGRAAAGGRSRVLGSATSSCGAPGSRSSLGKLGGSVVFSMDGPEDVENDPFDVQGILHGFQPGRGLKKVSFLLVCCLVSNLCHRDVCALCFERGTLHHSGAQHLRHPAWLWVLGVLEGKPLFTGSVGRRWARERTLFSHAPSSFGGIRG